MRQPIEKAAPAWEPKPIIHAVITFVIAFMHAHVFTRENAWAIFVSFMLLLILLMAASSAQPHFVYNGF